MIEKLKLIGKRCETSVFQSPFLAECAECVSKAGLRPAAEPPRAAHQPIMLASRAYAAPCAAAGLYS
jgi:hypothetical protein